MSDFLLQNDTAKIIYNSIKDLPIIDIHNHLDPKEILENKPFSNISNMWLDFDHYKWRIMRFSGYESHQTDNLKRFKDYISSIENAYGNPLYHWSKLELNTFFEIDLDITSSNAEEIYSMANTYLQNNPFGPYDLLQKLNVEILCTTDHITSDLKYHKELQEKSDIKVYPTFRPDLIFSEIPDVFIDTISTIENLTNTSIYDLQTLQEAIEKRVSDFSKLGCRLADHGITEFSFRTISKTNANLIFKKRKNNLLVSQNEVHDLNAYILQCLFKEYSKRGWTVQLHLGALRNQNEVGFELYGYDSGYDSISGKNYTNDLNLFFNNCRKQFQLPRTIIYPMNINHYEEIASICGNFSELEGHIQLGAAWWMNDHINGIIKHLKVFSEYLNISNFIGMVTDSRSFLSFTRHDYFRRILSNYLGKMKEEGMVTSELEHIIKTASRIAYYNSKEYLAY